MGLDENKVNFTAQHNFLIEFWEEENLVSRPVFCPVAFYTLYNSTWSLDMFRSRILFALLHCSFQACSTLWPTELLWSKILISNFNYRSLKILHSSHLIVSSKKSNFEISLNFKIFMKYFCFYGSTILNQFFYFKLLKSSLGT